MVPRGAWLAVFSETHTEYRNCWHPLPGTHSSLGETIKVHFLFDLPLFGCFGEGGRRYLSRKSRALVLVAAAGFAGALLAAVPQGSQEVLGSCCGKSGKSPPRLPPHPSWGSAPQACWQTLTGSSWEQGAPQSWRKRHQAGMPLAFIDLGTLLPGVLEPLG